MEGAFQFVSTLLYFFFNIQIWILESCVDYFLLQNIDFELWQWDVLIFIRKSYPFSFTIKQPRSEFCKIFSQFCFKTKRKTTTSRIKALSVCKTYHNLWAYLTVNQFFVLLTYVTLNIFISFSFSKIYFVSFRPRHVTNIWFVPFIMLDLKINSCKVNL